jgi:hypothetical protein
LGKTDHFSSARGSIPFEWHHGALCRFNLLRSIPRFFTQGGSVAKAILIDQFHITVYVLPGLAPSACDAIRQALDEPRFKADLRRAVLPAVRRHLPSDQVRITVTQ